MKKAKLNYHLPSRALMGPPPVVNERDPVPKEAFGKSIEKQPSTENAPSLTLKERFDIFMNETSFTALTRVHKASTVVKKVIWLIVLIGMLSWLGVQCFWLFEKYFGYPVEVKIDIKTVPKLDFPSVTICNRNPLRKSMVAGSPFDAMSENLEVKQDDSLYDMAMSMFQKTDDYNRFRGQHDTSGQSNASSTTNQTSWTTTTSTATTTTSGQATSSPFPTLEPAVGIVQTNQTTINAGTTTQTPGTLIDVMKQVKFNPWDALTDENTADKFYSTKDSECANMLAYSEFVAGQDPDSIKQYGHDIKDLLMACKFNGYPCSPENFTYIHNAKFGNCFTINHHQNKLPSIQSTYEGPLMGLVMEFNIEQAEYIAALSSDAGVRVLVHDRGTYPFPEDSGFAISPGHLTSVGIKQIRLTRLPPPHAGCANQGTSVDYYSEKYGTTYSKSTCLKSCYQRTNIKACDCAISIFLNPTGAKLCDFADKSTMKCISKINLEPCDTECPSPCSEIRYENTLSMSNWPSSAYSEKLSERMGKTSVDFMDGGPNGHGSKISENLAKLEVFYTKLAYESIEQQKGYESQNLISDVGGQLGLWLGLSAITIGELVEFIMAVFKAVTARAVRRKNAATPVERLDNNS